jgi:hypothetical protein
LTKEKKIANIETRQFAISTKNKLGIMTANISARDLFRAAYENRYTWDRNFPGFTADVTFNHNDASFQGQVRVNADLSAEVNGIDDKEAADTVKNQLREVAIHRIRRTFEETHGKNEFEYGEPQADGSTEILVGGKSSGDRYRVKDNIVTLVHRHIHGIVVTINTLSAIDTNSGYLSQRYDSIYNDPQTGEQKGGKTVSEDNYTQVGDYFLLTSREVVSTADDKEDRLAFGFQNLALLPAKVEALV